MRCEQRLQPPSLRYVRVDVILCEEEVQHAEYDALVRRLPALLPRARFVRIARLARMYCACSLLFGDLRLGTPLETLGVVLDTLLRDVQVRRLIGHKSSRIH